MRLFVHDYSGHPFQVQLSRGLAARGHRVLHVYSASYNTPHGALTRGERDPKGFVIEPITLSRKVKKYAFVDRFRLESEYGRRLVDLVDAFRPDSVLTANTPSLVGHKLSKFCYRKSIRLINWIQDLYGLAAYRILKRKLPVVGHAVGRYFMRLDGLACRRSEGIVVITEDFCRALGEWGIEGERIHVIHNWAPLEDLPVRPRENDWASEKGLSSGTRFVYSGTLSIRHNPRLLLQLGIDLQQQKTGELIVVSQGEGADWLRERVQEHGLNSIKIFPFQSFEQMANVFGCADVLVAILEPEAGVFCVPSKVLSYLCAGRPLLAAIPKENLSARIVHDYDAGLVVDPTDTTAFVAAAEQLATEPIRRAQMGAAARRYAEEHFDFQRICDRFESLLIGASPVAERSGETDGLTLLSRRNAA